MHELVDINEIKERKATQKLKRMQSAILKVGTLQEKSHDNNKKQCDYITELLRQVDLLKLRLKESDEARTILDSLCKEQEYQLLINRKENMLRDLEEEKNFRQEMLKRIADMEQQNDYLQRKLSHNCEDFKAKDTEIEKLQSTIKALTQDNKKLRKQLDNFKDCYQSQETLSLINECRVNSKKRLIDEVTEKSNEDLQRHRKQEDYESKIKAKLFDVSRKAAEMIR